MKKYEIKKAHPGVIYTGEKEVYADSLFEVISDILRKNIDEEIEEIKKGESAFIGDFIITQLGD